MSKPNRIFAVVLIVAFISAAVLPALAIAIQPDIVQITHEIKYRENDAKPESPGKPKPAPSSPDYKISINRGTTDIPITLTVYTKNLEDIPSSDFSAAISNAASEWDKYTSAYLVNYVEVKSSGSSTVTYNGENSVFFADLSSGTIAMASYWYNRATKEIVECDIQFNTDYAWGTSGSETVMDLQNIATHELGHFFNLADIYDSSKSALTMYGYSWEGDIGKRTLETGDIAGIQAVFGPQ
jgi:predicted Zn-dependent protease